MGSLFEQIGNQSKIQDLANEFYDVMDEDPQAKELRDIHPNNLTMSKKALYKFITHWLGGPKLFGEQYVNAKWLELRHRRFDLTESQKQQWLYCMNKAIMNIGLDNDLKIELNSKFESMIKSMRIQRSKINDISAS